MSTKESEGYMPEPPEEEPQISAESDNEEEEEDIAPPFVFDDPFWKSTTFHGSDAQLGAAVIAHEVKGLLKSLLGF